MIISNQMTGIKEEEYMEIFNSMDSDELAKRIYAFHRSRGRTTPTVLEQLDYMLNDYLENKAL